MNALNIMVWLAAALLVGGCAKPFAEGVDLGGGHGPVDMAGVQHRDFGPQDLSSNIPCDLGAGFHSCNGVCISPSQCCSGNDCPAPPTGQALCMNGVCVVSCNAGYRACGTNCIPNGSCCADGDCQTTPHVAAAKCNTTNGTCHVGMCAAGFYDLDGMFTNGCECADQGKARACGTATQLGNVPLGGLFSTTGNLPQQGFENWFQVTFTGETDKAYHPKIALTTNPGNAFTMDVVSNCANGAQGCGEGGSANGTLTWEVFYTGGDAVPPAGQNPPVQTWAPIPAVGTGGTVFVRVFRANATVDCATYGLTISN